MRLLATALLIALAACTAAEEPAAPTPAGPDLEAARAELIPADMAWYESYAAADDPAQAFVDMLVADAYLLPPDAPLAVGNDEIHPVISELEAMPGFSVRWEPSIAEVGSGADLGYTLGTYRMAFEQDGQPIVINGKYITVWRKQADGSWKVTADMFNADAPPGASE